jgi:uncharacterized protein (TIGR02145 family)
MIQSLLGWQNWGITWGFKNPTSSNYTATFNVSPADSVVTLDGVVGTNVDGVVTFIKTPGSYSYSVTKTGYIPEIGTLDVSGDVTLNITLIITSNVKYGYLYNWYSVNTPNFAPSGWHVPTLAEWNTLENYLTANGYNYDDTTVGQKFNKALATSSGWYPSATEGAPGNTDYPAKRNATGFSAMPGGFRDAYNGGFSQITGYFALWTKSGSTASSAYSEYIGTSSVDPIDGDDSLKFGFSVRMLKDDSVNPGSITDYDGNIYLTVKIGNQVWLIQSWACSKLNTGTSLTKVTNNTTWKNKTTEAFCAYNNDESNVFI